MAVLDPSGGDGGVRHRDRDPAARAGHERRQERLPEERPGGAHRRRLRAHGAAHRLLADHAAHGALHQAQAAEAHHTVSPVTSDATFLWCYVTQ